ncbi:hypothetical protein DH2020_041008 [Rehmannia glutinosa]|uniref:Uncharacterized protein n=1 Tax=Rehmannia glutinosa TaxID=99300 RepID=A0ABR0USJ9_REHGL
MDFGYDGVNCNATLDALVAMEVRVQNAPESECWFHVGEQTIRFSRRDFAMISELRFSVSTFDPNGVFEIWAFEAIPRLGNAWATRVSDTQLPRCLRWRFSKTTVDMIDFFFDTVLLGSSRRRTNFSASLWEGQGRGESSTICPSSHRADDPLDGRTDDASLGQTDARVDPSVHGVYARDDPSVRQDTRVDPSVSGQTNMLVLMRGVMREEIRQIERRIEERFSRLESRVDAAVSQLEILISEEGSRLDRRLDQEIGWVSDLIQEEIRRMFPYIDQYNDFVHGSQRYPSQSSQQTPPSMPYQTSTITPLRESTPRLSVSTTLPAVSTLSLSAVSTPPPPPTVSTTLSLPEVSTPPPAVLASLPPLPTPIMPVLVHSLRPRVSVTIPRPLVLVLRAPSPSLVVSGPRVPSPSTPFIQVRDRQPSCLIRRPFRDPRSRKLDPSEREYTSFLESTEE